MTMDNKMHAVQRHGHILGVLDRIGFITVPKMAGECGVSEMTMRRDLDKLAELGRLERTHGGAIGLDRAVSTAVDLVEPSFNARSIANAGAKAAIAKRAVSLITPGTTISLDIGSTTFELARCLSNMSLNVYTSSLKIAAFLAEKQPNIYVPGGQIVGSEPSVIGPQAVQHLGALYFDIAFIGVSGVSEAGFHDYSLEDTEVKRIMINSAQKTAVLMDSSKFDRVSVALVSAFDGIDMLITDAQLPDRLQDACQTAGIDVLLA